MLSYIGKRLLLMIPTLIGVVTVVFLIIQLVPGGPIEQVLAEARAGAGGDSGSYTAKRDVDKKQIEDLKKLYGFDKPLHVRYFEMLGKFATFDLGRSFLRNQDVWSLIKSKLPVSISLGLWTFLISYLISIPLGILKAVREGSKLDTFTTVHLALPLICYAIGSFAVLTFLTKNTFVEEIRKQYVLVARAKGISQRRILYKHVLRNALVPLVTGFPAAFVGAFFAGALLIETIFSLDGLGYLSYESLIRRDYPVVLGSLYLFTLIGLVVKLIGDLMYVVVDPRVQFSAVAK
jgi:microcin C transport system permease protein